ncbi:MAG: inorganic diphosphatase [Fimbriimonadaceae bacterium]
MSLMDIPLGKRAPQEFNVVIEIPRFSSNKYEFDPDLGAIRLDRVLFSPLFYPWDYGFLPQTNYLDGDPIDALVLVSHPTFPGCVIESKPIGVLEMDDGGKPDEKLICVALKDPRFGERSSLSELNPHTVREIEHFFQIYKLLEEKQVTVKGMLGPETAIDIVEKYRLAR